MPIYPYECDCGHSFETACRISDRLKLCPKCPACATILSNEHRRMAIVNFANVGVEDTEFCPALGCLVKGQKDRERIAKSRGLEPLGDEPIHKVNQFFDDKKKTHEKKLDDELRHTVMSALQ